MEEALLRDNPSDQKGDQHHDRDSLPADTIELIGSARSAAASAGARATPSSATPERAEHLQEHQRRRGGGAVALADLVEGHKRSGVGLRLRRRRAGG